MSERDDDLETAALQRQLDDAFATTRPRPGFEDELWTRMQASRPAGNPLRDALAGVWQAVRAVPAVPAAGVAAALVLAVGVGLFAYSGVGRGGGAATTASQFEGVSGDKSAAGFGRIPPAASAGSGAAGSGSAAPDVPASLASGSTRYVWAGTGSLAAGPATAPVYRYHEPSAADADQLASALGVVLRDRPSGLLGSYSASTYTLNIRGTLQTPPSSPTYFIIASPSMPAVDAASGNPADVATVFLAAHSLVPDWEPRIIVDTQGDLVRVRFARQFQVAGYGAATLVDPAGQPYGVEVDLMGNRPVLVQGLLPLVMDAADYRIVSPATALQAVVGAQPAPATPSATPAAGAPAVQLTKVELVYVLVPAGDHSYYEPAYLFSGSVKTGGATVPRNVLVPAVDPSQRAAHS